MVRHWVYGAWNSIESTMGRAASTTALGPLADDGESLAVLRAVLQPPFFEAIRAGTRSTDEASAIVTAVITPWLVTRMAERRSTTGSQEKERP